MELELTKYFTMHDDDRKEDCGYYNHPAYILLDEEPSRGNALENRSYYTVLCLECGEITSLRQTGGALLKCVHLRPGEIKTRNSHIRDIVVRYNELKEVYQSKGTPEYIKIVARINCELALSVIETPSATIERYSKLEGQQDSDLFIRMGEEIEKNKTKLIYIATKETLKLKNAGFTDEDIRSIIEGPKDHPFLTEESKSPSAWGLVRKK